MKILKIIGLVCCGLVGLPIVIFMAVYTVALSYYLTSQAILFLF